MPAYVVEADVELAPGADPAAVGAAVTVELCGHWEHEGPCRWPHNNAIEMGRTPARFRTLFVADEDEEEAVRARIATSLRAQPGWRVLDVRTRGVADDERELAGRLTTGPRRVD
jgi:hypothetical protein